MNAGSSTVSCSVVGELQPVYPYKHKEVRFEPNNPSRFSGLVTTLTDLCLISPYCLDPSPYPSGILGWVSASRLLPNSDIVSGLHTPSSAQRQHATRGYWRKHARCNQVWLDLLLTHSIIQLHVATNGLSDHLFEASEARL